MKNAATKEIKGIRATDCSLCYNKELVLVWKIIGEYSTEYENEDYSFYAEVHINASTGKIEYSQIG